ncbi:hypothetical protein B4V02_14535 [Paenibacillus kribbensis]|uniref:Uncharacterized protein n=1 Tax=Paenibacillus kribbensis TaxID=172713 RepID=A0A222WMW6_9BACL|nr:hypothetical protein B4V02_14535 [Paenibacillus kribbensis]
MLFIKNKKWVVAALGMGVTYLMRNKGACDKKTSLSEWIYSGRLCSVQGRIGRRSGILLAFFYFHDMFDGKGSMLPFGGTIGLQKP